MVTDFEGGTWRRIAENGRLMVFERLDGGGDDEREVRLCGVFDDTSQLALIFNVIISIKALPNK